MNIYTQTIRTTIKMFPAVIPMLKGRARWIAAADGRYYSSHMRFGPYALIYTTELLVDAGIDVKSYEYYLQQLERLIRSVYNGDLGGEFIDVMANLISGQINQAFEQAWSDEGDEGELPQYLQEAADELILGQYDHVDQFYRDVVDAKVDETPLDGLLARAVLWAQRWTEGYNQAVALIAADNGDNLIWTYGDDIEVHCPECAALNGLVARASDWESLNVHPQGAPNDKISCGGWRCGCTLSPTDKRRSPKVFDTIMNIVSK